MNKKQIKDLALSNGFKLKEQPSGEMDLNPYVYDFADALLAKANERVAGLEKEIQNIAASIGAGATIEDICNILEGYDSVEQLRKEQAHEKT